MSNTLYDEAIADAKLLRDTAEKNAKQAIIESVTPKIRKFIEDQLIGADQESRSESLSLDEGSDFKNDIMLDESALSALMNLIDPNSSVKKEKRSRFKSAFHESASSLGTNQTKKLLDITRKLKEDRGTLSSDGIVIGQELNNINIKENSDMSRNRETLYEVDLNDIMRGLSEVASDKDPQDEMTMRELHALLEQEEDEASDDLPPEGAPDEGLADDPAADMGPMLPPEVDSAMEDLETAIMDALGGGEGEEAPVEEMLPDEGAEEPAEEPLEETIEVDLDMLKTEIRRMRRLAEDGGEGMDPEAMEEDLYEVDEEEDSDSDKKDKKDVKVENRKLRRAILNQGRDNRAMGSKLDEYRSAVESLREQLTEMNLFNAKLLYVNKMLQNRDVSSTQRRSIIEALDSARSLREVKLLYKSLTESIGKRKSGRTLSESAVRRNLGSASRTTGRSSVENSESTEINRWAVLAGINNN